MINLSTLIEIHVRQSLMVMHLNIFEQEIISCKFKRSSKKVFVMEPFNLKCLHCSQYSFFEHLFNLKTMLPFMGFTMFIVI